MSVQIAMQIERLLVLAKAKQMIDDIDVIPCRNALLDLFGVGEPYGEAITEAAPETAVDILAGILDYCVESRIIDDTTTARDLMDARIMGLLMPRASETNTRFWQLHSDNPKAATDYLYNLSRDANYIRVDRIAKNLYWLGPTEFGDMEITINLSKPEKDAKEIAAAKAAPQTGYPKCLLCAENAGFAGNANHPARQNLRLIPLDLQNERWYLQYSPYVYYNEHCIVLKSEHTPMNVNVVTFKRLFDFVETFPHYFLGSNAGLPVVGGSILNHDHYQGGRHVFPMEKAPSYANYRAEGYPEIEISLVKWPMAVVRLTGTADKKDNAKIIELAAKMLDIWKDYNDEEAQVLSYSGDTSHNAVTPIVRVNRDGCFEMDFVLRNNRASMKHPLGIFHPHEHLHHIKKENIGLIEVMGLAVLPGRLEKELAEIRNILCGGRAYVNGKLEEDLQKHSHWIENMLAAYGDHNTPEQADEIIKNEVGLTFAAVLQDAGVFKYNEQGRAQFAKFIDACGFTPV